MVSVLTWHPTNKRPTSCDNSALASSKSTRACRACLAGNPPSVVVGSGWWWKQRGFANYYHNLAQQNNQVTQVIFFGCLLRSSSVQTFLECYLKPSAKVCANYDYDNSLTGMKGMFHLTPISSNFIILPQMRPNKFTYDMGPRLM